MTNVPTANNQYQNLPPTNWQNLPQNQYPSSQPLAQPVQNYPPINNTVYDGRSEPIPKN
jgi:hypothetical protein